MSKANPNDDAVNAGEAGKNALNTLRANLSMNAEDASVGAGLMAVHMDRGLEKQLKKDKKQARKDKSFNGMVSRIEAQMAEINAQIDWHTKEIAKIDGELDTLKTDKARLERGELPEKGADGKYSSATEKAIKEWEKKNGKKLDRNDPDIILAAILEREAILRAARAEHEIKKEGLKQDKKDIKAAVESGDPVIVRKVLDEKDVSELSYSSEDVTLQRVVDVELDKRVDVGEDVKKDISLNDRERRATGFNFLGKKSDEFAASAKAFEMTKGFNGAASGQMIVADMQIEQPQQIIERDNIITNGMIS